MNMHLFWFFVSVYICLWLHDNHNTDNDVTVKWSSTLHVEFDLKIQGVFFNMGLRAIEHTALLTATDGTNCSTILSHT